jgi:hypothetical protein
MNDERAHRPYALLFIAACVAVLLPVVTLNYLLGLRSLGGNDVVIEASRWQQATRGITYAPPLSANRPFKSARLFDRLPELNAIVLGSSTAMGVTQTMFPSEIVMYNFAQTGNLFSTLISEAEFLRSTNSNHPKWFFISFDWALGSPYFPGEAGVQTLAPPLAGGLAAAEPPISGRLADALSLPRVKSLFGTLARIVRAPSPSGAFREMFFQNASDEYRCEDGTPAKDFDTIFRGTCTGFRYDGSATFANLEPLSAQRVPMLIASAVVPSSRYASELIRARGELNSRLLEQLAATIQGIRRDGGVVMLMLPPLLPGLERALLESKDTAIPLRRTRETLDRWAQEQRVVFIDAGRSERFGCVAVEFVDEHHALPSCYMRIFSRFWRDWSLPRKISPGIWPNHE